MYTDKIKPLQTITIKASSQIEPYRLIDYAGNHTDNNEASMGISLNSAENGENFPCAVSGIVPVEINGSISKGELLSAAATGLAKAKFGSEPIVGRILEDGTAGDIVPILLLQS